MIYLLIDIDKKYCDLESINYYSQLSSQINMILMIAYYIFFVTIIYFSYKKFKKVHKNNLLFKKNLSYDHTRPKNCLAVNQIPQF